MLDEILVLLDGSALAQGALPAARALAQAFTANITLLRVLETDDKEMSTQVDPVSWHLRKAEAQAYLNNLRQTWPTSKKRPRVVLQEGTAVDRIIQYAETQEPDLVILTTHGQSGFSPSTISSVAYKIIHLLPTSFMLVRTVDAARAVEETARYKRIMVPLDGSRRAEFVLPFALKLAAAQDAELFLVHVASQTEMMQRRPLSPEEVDMCRRLDEHNRTEATLYLRQLAEHETVSITTRLLAQSQAADALIDFTQTEQIDLVMMSAHGQSGAQNRLHGSLIANFIHYSPAALFVMQDLPAEQIKTFRSQAAANMTGGLNREIAYAQPEDWNPN